MDLARTRRCRDADTTLDSTSPNPHSYIPGRRLQPTSHTTSPFLATSAFPFTPDSAQELLPDLDLATCFVDLIYARGTQRALPVGPLQWDEVAPASDAMGLAEAQALADEYFSTTHEWLSIGSNLQDLIDWRVAPDVLRQCLRSV